MDTEDDIEMPDADGEIEFEMDDEDGDDIEIEGEDGDIQFDDDGMDEEEGEMSEEKLKESLYYEAKQEDDVTECLDLFNNIIDMEEVKTRWGYKSLKQMVKRMFQSGMFDEMCNTFRRLLEYAEAVSRNQNESTINKILLMISSSPDIALQNRVYGIALNSLRRSGNEKLWFNTKLGQGNFLCRRQNWEHLYRVCVELKGYCSGPDGRPDPKKNSQLLEVYVLEIQMYTAKEEFKRLKELYTVCREFETKQGAVVSNPVVTGIIRECGGKMHMREKQWAKAYADFFESFKSYDEAGNVKRIKCLQYLIVVAMLRSSAEGQVIDPFLSSEVKPYATHMQIKAMTDLIKAYQNNNIRDFEGTLKRNRRQIESDPFLSQFVSDLLRSIRLKVLLVKIKPYRRVGLKYLSRLLQVNTDSVESLCADLILDEKLKASIDQINELLVLESVNRNESAKKRFDSLTQWAMRVKQIHTTVCSKID